MLDENGKQVVVTMGSYGVGVTRALACVAEGNHDEKGLVWPRSLAPADVHVVATGKDPEIFATAERLAGELVAQGIEVLYDDRPKVSPGVKFKDAELVGVPTILVVGKGLAEGVVELKDRRSGESEQVALGRRGQPRRRRRPRLSSLAATVVPATTAAATPAATATGVDVFCSTPARAAATQPSPQARPAPKARRPRLRTAVNTPTPVATARTATAQAASPLLSPAPSSAAAAFGDGRDGHPAQVQPDRPVDEGGLRARGGGTASRRRTSPPAPPAAPR